MQRRNFLKTFGVAAGASMIPFLRYLPAEAAGPSDTLVVVSGQGINSLDLHRKGTNRPSYQSSHFPRHTRDRPASSWRPRDCSGPAGTQNKQIRVSHKIISHARGAAPLTSIVKAPL